MGYYESLEPWQKELLDRHLELVIELNKTTNLTRITDFEEARILHIEDSLSALEELKQCKTGRYGDLGSGAGYPGLPLAIATGRKTVLIDSRQKKMDLMEGIIDELGLGDRVSTYAGRAELLARMNPKSFSALTARALAKLPVLLELASPLLEKGGRLICYKAQLEDEELKQAKSVSEATGLDLISQREFLLDGIYERRILVFEKCKKPRTKLPRREGEAQRNPLGKR